MSSGITAFLAQVQHFLMIQLRHFGNSYAAPDKIFCEPIDKWIYPCHNGYIVYIH